MAVAGQVNGRHIGRAGKPLKLGREKPAPTSGAVHTEQAGQGGIKGLAAEMKPRFRFSQVLNPHGVALSSSGFGFAAGPGYWKRGLQLSATILPCLCRRQSITFMSARLEKPGLNPVFHTSASTAPVSLTGSPRSGCSRECSKHWSGWGDNNDSCGGSNNHGGDDRGRGCTTQPATKAKEPRINPIAKNFLNMMRLQSLLLSAYKTHQIKVWFIQNEKIFLHRILCRVGMGCKYIWRTE